MQNRAPSAQFWDEIISPVTGLIKSVKMVKLDAVKVCK